MELQCAIVLKLKRKLADNCGLWQRDNVAMSVKDLMRCKAAFSGDVKKLTAKTDEYRLRVGSLRVLFTLEKDLISVYAVRDRKQAHE